MLMRFLLLAVIITPAIWSQERDTVASGGRQMIPLSEAEAKFNPRDFLPTPKEFEEILRAQEGDSTFFGIRFTEEAQGFRIQLFATEKPLEMQAVREQLRVDFPDDKIYLSYDQPIYKFRLGDFETREEARRKLQEVTERGYRSAWIVPDRIVIIRRPVR